MAVMLHQGEKTQYVFSDIILNQFLTQCSFMALEGFLYTLKKCCFFQCTVKAKSNIKHIFTVFFVFISPQIRPSKYKEIEQIICQ